MAGAQRGNIIVVALAILVPVTALLVALLPRVESLINQRPHDDLAEQAGTVARQTAERLTAADHLLRILSTDVVQSDSLNVISTSTRLDAFSDVALLRRDAPPVVIKGSAPTLGNLDASILAHISDGRTALITDRDGTGGKPAFLRAIGLSADEQPGLLFAELSSDYLWGSEDLTNGGAVVCIVDTDNRPVFCERPAASAGLANSAGGMAALAATRGSSDARIAQTSRIDLTQAFGADDWIVSVSDRNATVAGPAGRWSIVYIISGMAAMTLSIALAGWLTRRRAVASGKTLQTSRTTPPGGTASPAKSVKVIAVKADSHAQTTDAAARALHLFSEIDRAILSGATFERIVESTLNHVQEIFPGNAAAFAFLDRDKPSACRMMLIDPENGHESLPIESALEARSTASLASIANGEWFASTAEDALLAPLHEAGMDQCFLSPVFRDGVPTGALIIANKTTRTLDKFEHGLARDIAHRLGVAYTATARGQELLFHSMYDSITELPNRKFFENRLEEEISRARRESRRLALLLVDLDKFKEVNDSYGHEAGDVLLEQASARLKTCLRTEDLVARIGSDEFAILLPSISQGRDIANVAKKLIETLSESYLIQGRGHHLSASIGVAVFPKDGNSGRALLSGADFAMHASKRRGGATYSSYEVQSNEQAQERTALTNDLRQAIAKQELVLYFQPQIDLVRGNIVGAEALLRWRHPTRGLIMPTEFIGIAEQSDLIEQIGDFVRLEASKQFRAWESEGTAPMRISINVSSRELRSANFLEKVEETLLTSGLRPFSLELEITESLLLEHSDHVVAVLRALNNRGVRIALDDFGTGYSSMAYLKKIPFHVLKIDRFFVKDIGTEDGSDSIVHAIIGVAQGLGKEIVSEGIETEEQRAFLAENGCDLAQGFLWSPPVPADEFAALMRNWNKSAHLATTLE